MGEHIFGTLLERALDPVERHELGAHYTPRAYAERRSPAPPASLFPSAASVISTVVETLRAEWDAARAAAGIARKVW